MEMARLGMPRHACCISQRMRENGRIAQRRAVAPICVCFPHSHSERHVIDVIEVIIGARGVVEH